MESPSLPVTEFSWHIRQPDMSEQTCKLWIEVNQYMFLMDYLESILSFSKKGLHYINATCNNINVQQENLKKKKKAKLE